jgi:hypothetical protein
MMCEIPTIGSPAKICSKCATAINGGIVEHQTGVYHPACYVAFDLGLSVEQVEALQGNVTEFLAAPEGFAARLAAEVKRRNASA